MRTQVEIISDPNYLLRIPFEKIIFKVPNLVCTSYFSGHLEGENVLEFR